MLYSVGCLIEVHYSLLLCLIDSFSPSESEMYQIHVVLVEIRNHFLCDWMAVYFHYITCSTSVNCFLPIQIHQEIIQCSFCELFYDSIHNKWYESAALFSVCILDRWEPDHASTKIISWFIPTNDQISSIALVATSSIIIRYCNRFSLVMKIALLVDKATHGKGNNNWFAYSSPVKVQRKNTNI